jgi:hypothetical protein
MAMGETQSGCIVSGRTVEKKWRDRFHPNGSVERKYRFIRDQWRNQFPAHDYSGRWKGKNWSYFLSHDEPGMNSNDSYIDAFNTKRELFAWVESQNADLVHKGDNVQKEIDPHGNYGCGVFLLSEVRANLNCSVRNESGIHIVTWNNCVFNCHALEILKIGKTGRLIGYGIRWELDKREIEERRS